MGEHKTNPTAILSKQGKIEPKKKPPSRNLVKRITMATLVAEMFFGDRDYREAGYWKK